MKFGFVYPIGDAKTIAEAAYLAEKSGWDAFYTWEPVWGIDAWIALTAAALRTTKIKLGTMLSPLPRLKPWKLASESATFDNLSGGRTILSVGLGALDDAWLSIGELTDRKTRAELLDEGLVLLENFWKGKPFSFTGKHYNISQYDFFLPPPTVQKPRIPIWVVGALGYEKSMNRAFKYDGILPTLQKKRKNDKLTIEDIKEIKKIAREKHLKNEFDIILEPNHLPEDFKLTKNSVKEWEDAGATWFTVGMWETMEEKDPHEKIFNRIRRGPFLD